MTLPPLPKPGYPAARLGLTQHQAYTADELSAYGEACAAAERERCVQRCIDIGQTGQEAAFTADRCVAAIRSAE